MAESYIEPQSLDKANQLEMNDKVMVTHTDNKTEVVLGIAIVGVECSCASAANVETKEVTLANYTETTLPNNALLHVTFTNGNTYGDTTAASPTHPKVQVKNASGAVLATLDLCDSRGHFAGKGSINAGDVITLRRVGTKALMINTDVRQVDTTAGTTIYADGTVAYSKNGVDGTLNGALTNYPKYIYKANGQITQNVTKVIDLTNKVEKARNYKIIILANYNAVYYFEGIMSLNYSTNFFQIIPIVRSEFIVTSTEAYKINIDYAKNTSNYSISIIEC